MKTVCCPTALQRTLGLAPSRGAGDHSLRLRRVAGRNEEGEEEEEGGGREKKETGEEKGEKREKEGACGGVRSRHHLIARGMALTTHRRH